MTKNKTLKEYLDENFTEISAFANQIGYSREHISNICNGNGKASAGLKFIIYTVTKGQVDMNKTRPYYLNSCPQNKKKLCDICAKEFITNYSNKKYCDECKADLHKKPKMK